MMTTDIAPDSSPNTASETAVRKHLESIIRTLIDCLNNHTLDPQTYPHKALFAANFTVYAPQAGGTLDLEGYLRLLQGLIKQNPEYHMHSVEFSSSLDANGRGADVFVNWKVSGNPAGVVKPGVGVFRFQRDRDDDGGVWRCWRYEGHDGMEGTEGGLW